MCNYFNGEDWALDLWEKNNRGKPDGAWGYCFGYGGSTNFYDETVIDTNRFYRWWGYIEGLEITNGVPDLRERYEVFSCNVESRAKALGQASNSTFSVNFELSGVPLLYNDRRYSHSKQFRSNILAERVYYENIILHCGF